MAEIYIQCSSLTGEATKTEELGALEATAVRDMISAPVGNQSAVVTEIAVVRTRDRATVALLQACAAAKDLGEVLINVYQSGRKTLVYKLRHTYVSRIEFETADTSGMAYVPHQGFSGAAPPSWRSMSVSLGATVNDAREYSRWRAAPRPVYSEPPGLHTNDEIERVWFSADAVTWTYTPYNSEGSSAGNIEASWDLQTRDPILEIPEDS